MTQNEALRLALEALEKLFGIPDKWTGEGEGDVAVWRLGGSYRAQQAITAIKAALSGEAQTRSVVKDEPVAWRDAAIRLGEELSSVGPDGYYDMDAKEWLDWAIEQNPRGKHSLPQRTWVGLTDEEINALDYSGTRIEFVRAIEAKLRSKNHD